MVAAGASRRMGGTDKLFAMLGGMPVLAYALRALEAAESIERITIVTRPERIVLAEDVCRVFGITKAGDIVAGGATRTESVLAGVKAARGAIVAVHDGARPFIRPELIDALVAAAAVHGAAAPAVRVKDTIKQVDADGFVCATPSREVLRAVQTPQVFSAELLRGALIRALERGESPTDDCAAVENAGARVLLIDGDERNIKITTPADFLAAEAFLEEYGVVGDGAV